MSFAGRLAYLLAALPFLADFLESGRWATSPLSLAINAGLSVLILVIIALLRQARTQERRINSLRKLMNQAIIHDLKNPMTSIMGCLSCLINDSPAPAVQDRLLRIALHSCRSQMALLETLVDTTRIEQGELKARRAPLVIREVIDDILEDAKGAAAHLDVTLKESVATDVPAELNADAEFLRRILANLLHNALKYTPAGGSVSLDIRLEGDALRFSVKDTGIGISPKHVERLFDKYYRVEGSDQSTRRGSGLGLYFCRLAVEAHGGTIRVSSAADQGTTVVFDIPKAVKEDRGS